MTIFFHDVHQLITRNKSPYEIYNRSSIDFHFGVMLRQDRPTWVVVDHVRACVCYIMLLSAYVMATRPFRRSAMIQDLPAQRPVD